jgi:outer membrane murein-binding lipoprotein Lpp
MDVQAEDRREVTMAERGPTTKSVDEDLGDLRQEVKELTRSVNGLRTDYAVVERDLKLIRWIGVFFAGVLVAVVLGAGRVVWDAATVTGKVDRLSEDVKELKSDVKQMAKQLDTIARQTAPKAGG